MFVFGVVAALLVLVIFALIFPALWRTRSTSGVNANTEKRAIFRQQFTELESDKESGVLDAEQYELAKAELERRFIQEIGNAESVTLVTAPDRRLAVILFISIPLCAGLLYYKLGSPVSITMPVTTPEVASSDIGANHSSMMSDLEPLLESLKRKLEQNPGDGDGWALLARSYVELRQHAKSISAYEHAVKLIPDDPQLLADYADALAVVNGHELKGKPEELINQALKLDSHHVKAQMLAATAAYNRKDYQRAITHWQQLQQDLPKDSELLPEINASLEETRLLSGQGPSEKVEGAKLATGLSGAGISGTVSVASSLVPKLDPDATVFVFAKAVKGNPMPLAIVRTTVSKLPYAYHLDDSVAVMPTHKLSQVDEVVLVARISKSGDAKQASGDLQGVTSPVKTNGSVDIEINQIIP